MVVVDRVLYVADLDTIRAFNTDTGMPVHTVSFQQFGEVGLADVVYDGHGLLYASDTEANIVYKIEPGRQHAISVFVKDSALAGPRGLAVHPHSGHLIVASWKKGKILEVDAQAKITELVSNSFFSSRFGNLDGVDFDTFGNMYVADTTGGKVWRMRADRKFDVIAEFLNSPADISVDRTKHLILVPYAYGNAAEMNGLESPIKDQKQKRTLVDYGFGSMDKFKQQQKDKEREGALSGGPSELKPGGSQDTK
jgi:sugar lactone lactonase YvrE